MPRTSWGPVTECSEPACAAINIIFPLTYIIGDIVAEVYGYTVAKKIIWVTLICELFFAITIQ